MPRKRTGYDAACYYDGKLLGRCTKADSDAYTLLMNACGGDAARVLREYAYFSPELKVILEKAALMQADRSRTGGMFHAPKSSPWGEVQSCETLCPGVFLVSTASHGGTMVANEVAAVLSPAAKKCGFKDKGYICYEEDAQESVVLRELLDKKLWNMRYPARRWMTRLLRRSWKKPQSTSAGPMCGAAPARPLPLTVRALSAGCTRPAASTTCPVPRRRAFTTSVLSFPPPRQSPATLSFSREPMTAPALCPMWGFMWATG